MFLIALIVINSEALTELLIVGDCLPFRLFLCCHPFCD